MPFVSRLMLSAVLLVSLGACAYQAELNTAHFPPPNVGLTASGKAAVVMDPAEEKQTVTAHPESFTGGGSTLEVPVNRIVTEATKLAFDAALDGSVIRVGKASEAPEVDYFVEPRVIQNSFKFDQLSTLGFAIIPKATLVVSIKITRQDGSVILEKTYERKDESGGAYAMSFKPHERINRAYHRAAMEIAQEAAEDLARAIRSAPR